MEWYVYRHNVNSRAIEPFNVFNHGSFNRDVIDLKSRRLERDKFAYELNRIAMYYFWCKSEYEVVISELHEHDIRVEEKIDIYHQIKSNWELFVDYVYGKFPPCRIGDSLLYYRKYTLCEKESEIVTVSMLTQKADGTWKIRVAAERGRGKITFDLNENDIGKRLIRMGGGELGECVFYK